MGLRRASTETTRLDLGDGDFVEVSQDISKKDFNRLAASMPTDLDEDAGNLTMGQATAISQTLFDVFVKGWSSDAPPTVEEYLALTSEDAARIDAAVMSHFNQLTTVSQNDTKKPKTSRRTASEETGATIS